eukprot:Lankesteria_metandrocarpae@DN3081_c0_g1_i2.p1
MHNLTFHATVVLFVCLRLSCTVIAIVTAMLHSAFIVYHVCATTYATTSTLCYYFHSTLLLALYATTSTLRYYFLSTLLLPLYATTSTLRYYFHSTLLLPLYATTSTLRYYFHSTLLL